MGDKQSDRIWIPRCYCQLVRSPFSTFGQWRQVVSCLVNCRDSMSVGSLEYRGIYDFSAPIFARSLFPRRVWRFALFVVSRQCDWIIDRDDSGPTPTTKRNVAISVSRNTIVRTIIFYDVLVIVITSVRRLVKRLGLYQWPASR